mmetsp:Transcript_27515/g.80311  ORF Transcript_27515/g.80311 Transcript_27515/m.80311 type:complete len:1708 (-) Transcript_27515:92-5215(-)
MSQRTRFGVERRLEGQRSISPSPRQKPLPMSMPAEEEHSDAEEMLRFLQDENLSDFLPHIMRQAVTSIFDMTDPESVTNEDLAEKVGMSSLQIGRFRRAVWAKKNADMGSPLTVEGFLVELGLDEYTDKFLEFGIERWTDLVDAETVQDQDLEDDVKMTDAEIDRFRSAITDVTEQASQSSLLSPPPTRLEKQSSYNKASQAIGEAATEVALTAANEVDGLELEVDEAETMLKDALEEEERVKSAIDKAKSAIKVKEMYGHRRDEAEWEAEEEMRKQMRQALELVESEASITEEIRVLQKSVHKMQKGIDAKRQELLAAAEKARDRADEAHRIASNSANSAAHAKLADPHASKKERRSSFTENQKIFESAKQARDQANAAERYAQAAEKESKTVFPEEADLEEQADKLKELQTSKEQLAFASQSLRTALPRDLEIDGTIRPMELLQRDMQRAVNKKIEATSRKAAADAALEQARKRAGDLIRIASRTSNEPGIKQLFSKQQMSRLETPRQGGAAVETATEASEGWETGPVLDGGAAALATAADDGWEKAQGVGLGDAKVSVGDRAGNRQLRKTRSIEPVSNRSAKPTMARGRSLQRMERPSLADGPAGAGEGGEDGGQIMPILAPPMPRTTQSDPDTSQIVLLAESYFTIDENSSVLKPILFKAKNPTEMQGLTNRDLADMCKKLATAFTTVCLERDHFKESCITVEQNLQQESHDLRQYSLMAQAIHQRLVARVKSMKETQDNLKKSIKTLVADREAAHETLEQMKKSWDGLRHAMQAGEGARSMLAKRLAQTEDKLVQAQKRMDELLNHTSQKSQDISSTITQQEQDWLKRFDTADSYHRREVERLQAQLERSNREAELERTRRERAEQRVMQLEELIHRLDKEKMEETNTGGLQNQRLQIESSQVKEALAKKSEELIKLMATFAEANKANQLREDEARDDAKDAMDKAAEMERRVHEREKELAALRANTSGLNSANSNLEKQIAELKDSLKAAEQSRMTAEETGRHSANHLLVEREKRIAAEVREADALRERIAANAELMAVKDAQKVGNTGLESKVLQLEARIRELEALLEAKDAEIAALKKQHKEKTIALQSEIETYKGQVGVGSEDYQQMVEEHKNLKAQLALAHVNMKDLEHGKLGDVSRLEAQVSEVQGKLRESERQRRGLHNRIQELRGNVRVMVRCRPFLPQDHVHVEEGDPPPTPTCQFSANDESGRIKITNPGSDESFFFEFDKCFSPSQGQHDVFKEVSDFVQSALDGYSVCIFSYGQTGSGKTHTMTGSGHGPMRGIIPRSMEMLDEQRLKRMEDGWEFDMSVTIFEIYNELIKDLLTDSAHKGVEHDVKHDAKGNVYVTNLTFEHLQENPPEEVFGLLERAARLRSVASTNMNEQSSRSHTVFTIHINAKNTKMNVKLTGKMNLCDLAGSERINRSGATGDRLKEATAINKSLSSLTDVFAALANKQPFVPFRNSKLTYILQPALSGDGKTLMFVNLSPTDESYFESLSSLRFAERVSQVELGKARRTIERAEGDHQDPLSKPTPTKTRGAATGGGRPELKRTGSYSKSPVASSSSRRRQSMSGSTRSSEASRRKLRPTSGSASPKESGRKKFSRQIKPTLPLDDELLSPRSPTSLKDRPARPSPLNTADWKDAAALQNDSTNTGDSNLDSPRKPVRTRGDWVSVGSPDFSLPVGVELIGNKIRTKKMGGTA